MHTLINITMAAWNLLVQSSLYILMGIVVGGLLKLFLSPDYVARHLGTGKIKSVFKAALLGVPIPLCSCGVLPAAAQLKNQGANKGATTAFLISTPESGVDSIAVSWALLDPLMTIARPVAAFFSAFVAGVLENMLFWNEEKKVARVTEPQPLPMFVQAGADSGCGCDHSAMQAHGWDKFKRGAGYAVHDIWGDLAGWFFVGLLIAAIITVLIPDDLITGHLSGGIGGMLLMLAVGVPMYICATASTPIAAALIVKGVSPGTALVFLLAGPATNITALTVLVKILGRKGVAVYLASIATISVLSGLALDALYFSLGIKATATIGAVAEIVPHWLMLAATGLLMVLTVPTFLSWLHLPRRAHSEMH